jgi:poly(3-hydroxybutyrate) depolymerase
VQQTARGNEPFLVDLALHPKGEHRLQWRPRNEENDMRSSVTFHVALFGLVAGLGAASGCSTDNGNSGLGKYSGGAGQTGTPGTAGTNSQGAAGAAGANTQGSAGTPGTAGMDNSGSAGSGGSGNAPGTAGEGTAGAGAAGAAGGGDAGMGAAGMGAAGMGAAGAAMSSDITKVVAAGTGCGKDAPAALTPGTLVKQSMMVMGMKDPMCADAKCGAWTDTREYWVRLPTGYKKDTPYPLVFEGPGCGGAGNNLYNIPVFNSTVIRVGVTPSHYWQAYHATNPNQGCFDDKEGDDSVDWVLYENLYDLLASTVCFDRNRVFSGGNSSGAWFSNELGCKYAGDSKRPVRGVMPNTGGLPTDMKYVPTCTTKPMAGFWSHETGDTTNPFSGNIVAMNRALGVNGCMPAGVTYDSATKANAFDPFPIGGGVADGTCKKYKGCPELYPLVVCPLPGTAHASHDNIVDPGWPTFLSLFSTGNLITQ